MDIEWTGFLMFSAKHSMKVIHSHSHELSKNTLGSAKDSSKAALLKLAGTAPLAVAQSDHNLQSK